MKKRLTIKQKIKACYMLFFNNSSLQYVIELEQRCEKANFAPFDDRVKNNIPHVNTNYANYGHFVWDAHTIQVSEKWMRKLENGGIASNDFLDRSFPKTDSAEIIAKEIKFLATQYISPYRLHAEEFENAIIKLLKADVLTFPPISNVDATELYKKFIDEFTDKDNKLVKCNPDSIYNWFRWGLWR